MGAALRSNKRAPEQSGESKCKSGFQSWFYLRGSRNWRIGGNRCFGRLAGQCSQHPWPKDSQKPRNAGTYWLREFKQPFIKRIATILGSWERSNGIREQPHGSYTPPHRMMALNEFPHATGQACRTSEPSSQAAWGYHPLPKCLRLPRPI